MRHGSCLLTLALLSLWLYAPSIATDTTTSGDYLLETESHALAAHRWQDHSGQAFPLFYQASHDVWLTPVPLYMGALLTQSFGLTNGVRWAAALTGMVDVLLAYVLAYIYYSQDRYADAEPIAQEVLAVDRRVLGDQHPLTLQAVHNVATLNEAAGRYDDAERVYRSALEGRRRVLGEAHPDTSATEMSLASMYLDQHRHAEVEPLALAAYRGFEASLGVPHAKTQGVVKQLASLYEALGRHDEAGKWKAKQHKDLHTGR